MPNESPQHEFSQEDSAAFSRLALKMRGVGFWFEIYGVIMILLFAFKLWPKAGSFEIAPMDLLMGLMFLLLGHWTRRGGLGFNQVAESEGSDLTYLMNAVRELSRVYGLIDRLIFVSVVLAIVGSVLVGIWLLKGGL
jgi:hypothetical protein